MLSNCGCGSRRSCLNCQPGLHQNMHPKGRQHEQSEGNHSRKLLEQNHLNIGFFLSRSRHQGDTPFSRRARLLAVTRLAWPSGQSAEVRKVDPEECGPMPLAPRPTHGKSTAPSERFLASLCEGRHVTIAHEDPISSGMVADHTSPWYWQIPACSSPA
jgi:hypothetical protein